MEVISLKGSDFLHLVEIRTKIASQFPLAFGLLYSLYRFGRIEPVNSLLMFLSLLLFDMTTTAVNNYIDYQSSHDEEYRRRDNIIGVASLSPGRVLLVIALLLIGATGSGIALAWRTGPVVLAIGAVSFAAGILYTAGPIPISRLPLGELFSGVFMGFLIPFLAVYIGNPGLVRPEMAGGVLLLRIDLAETGKLFLASLPFVLIISNLMLANNICDLEQDMEHNRYLLPYFIGLPRSLLLFRASYYLLFLLIPLAVALRVLPLLSLLTLACFPPVQRNINIFLGKQDKGSTFVTAVRNLFLVSIFYILPLGAAAGWAFLR